MWRNWNTCTWLVGIRYGTDTLDNSLAVSYKFKNQQFYSQKT